MARTSSVVYTCDGCKAEVERRDLRRFDLDERKMNGDCVVSTTAELCTSCEAELHKAVKRLWPEGEYVRLEGLVRP